MLEIQGPRPLEALSTRYFKRFFSRRIRKRDNYLASLIRPHANLLPSPLKCPKEPGAPALHFAMQAKLEARNFKVAKRLSLWTRAERRLKQSKWSGKRPNNIVNRKAREELIGMQDHIFRQYLPTHAREHELQLQIKQRKLQADQCRQKERQEWYDRHKPSVFSKCARFITNSVC